MKTQNAMASPYHSKFRSTQNMGAPLFFYLGHGAFCKGKVLSKNCNLSNLVNIQHSTFYELSEFYNIKRITDMC